MKIKFIILLIFVLTLTACSNKIKETSKDIDIPKYSQVTVLEGKEDKSLVYKGEPNGLYKIGTFPKELIDVNYSTLGSTVHLVSKAQGKNLINNLIKIYNNDKMMILDSFYSASDLKLNPAGDKLIYRSFKEDSFESAEGLKIFDIKSREYLKFDTKVLVSGNVYCWLDDNNIIYYGSTEETLDTGRIYKYNFEKNSEEVYIDNIEGFCSYMVTAGEGLVYLKESEKGPELIFFYKGKNTILSENVASIYTARFNSKTNEVFFAGNEKGLEDPALYKIAINNKGATRLTYDFPKTLEKPSNLCLDKAGNVYFTGMQGVYMYNIQDKSVNLVSKHDGKYKLYQDSSS